MRYAEPNKYSPATGSLKSRIPWLSKRSKTKSTHQGEKFSSVLEAVMRSKQKTKGTLLKSGLFNNLQDMFPYYLPKR
jgi:hypothetical protein